MPTKAWEDCAGDGLAADVPTPVYCVPIDTRQSVQAHRVTALNRVAVLRWVSLFQTSSSARISRGGIILCGKNGLVRHAPVGDWIIKPYDDEEFYAIPDAVFSKLYKVDRPVRRRRSA